MIGYYENRYRLKRYRGEQFIHGIILTLCLYYIYRQLLRTNEHMTEKMANRMSALDDEDTNSLTSFNLLGPVGEKWCTQFF
jgi:hypothetical protein